MKGRHPAHLLCRTEDIAERVITMGDPLRVRMVSRLLKEPKLINVNRGYLAYTGYHDGIKVTLCTHGIGSPSSAIVFEELATLGAKAIVRLGTTGAMVKGMNIGNYVIPTAAVYNEGAFKMYFPTHALPAIPDVKLTSVIIQECRKRGLQPFVGLVFSSDAFYSEDHKLVDQLTKLRVISIEMECATLFTLGLLRGFRTASLLIVSNSLVDPEQAKMIPSSGLRVHIMRAAKVLLDVLTWFPIDA